MGSRLEASLSLGEHNDSTGEGDIVTPPSPPRPPALSAARTSTMLHKSKMCQRLAQPKYVECYRPYALPMSVTFVGRFTASSL